MATGEISSSSLKRGAWLAVALLWPVALLNYLDRQLISTMHDSIMASVPSISTDARFGELMAVFLFVYGIFSPIGGYIADRFSRRWVIIASLGVWSIFTWLTGHAQTYDQLWWARALMGISEACYIPAALALIADFHPGRTQSRAVGVHQSGIYIGIILGGLGGYIADSHYGWRAGFHWFGLFGVLYAIVLFLFLKNAPGFKRVKTSGLQWIAFAAGIGVLFLIMLGALSGFRLWEIVLGLIMFSVIAIYAIALFLFYKKTPPPLADKNPEPQTGPGIGSWKYALLGAVSFILLVLYFTLPAMPGWVVKSWMPAMLADTFHIGQGKAGISATLWVTLASLGGVLLGGWLADRWMRRTERGRIYVSAIGMALCIPALFGIGYAPTLGVAVAFLILYGIGFGFFDTNNMPILSQIVPSKFRATGYGLMNMVSIMVGGYAVSKVGAMRDAHVPNSTIFTICAIAAVISVVLVLLIKPRIAKKDDAPNSR